MGLALPPYRQEPAPGWCARFVGLPYNEGGRGPDVFDCWGILLLVLREQFGIVVPAYEDVHWGPGGDRAMRRKTASTIASERAAHWSPIPAGQEQPGDCIVLSIAGQPLHVGAVAAPGWMLHGSEGADSALERYDGMCWRNRVDGFFRFTEAA